MFIFNGKSSDSMGVVLNDELIFPKPAINHDSVEIDGMDGSIMTPLNRKNVEMTVKATLLRKNNFDNVKAWLDGEGIFEYEGRYRKAYIFSDIDFERHGPFKYQFEITFIFEPYWHRKDAYTQVTDTVLNAGNVEAKPLIKLVGTGTVDLTVNDVRFAVTFDSDGEIEIDCEKMEETKPKCIYIGFKYPTLHPGVNSITFHSGKAKVFIQKKDRWI